MSACSVFWGSVYASRRSSRFVTRSCWLPYCSTYITNNLPPRSLNFWAGMAVMCFVIAHGLWLHRHQPYRGAINYLMGVFFVNGLLLAGLAPTVFLGDLGNDVFSPTAALAATYFIALILSTLWTLGVVILVSQRLNVEHDLPKAGNASSTPVPMPFLSPDWTMAWWSKSTMAFPR